MYKIVEARTVGLNIKQFTIEAPRIARKQKPGQFLILRLHEKGERIPLTIKSSDPAAGTVTIVVQGIGKTTMMMNSLEAGDSILDIVGPLGKPSEIEPYGTAVILAGSVGTAMALPTANALKKAGNHVVFIEGARSKEMVVFEDEVRAASEEAYVMTDDGSYGEQGLVTKKLNELIAAGRTIDFVLAVGPVPMMRAVAQITGPLGIKTMVSLNSIMVDGPVMPSAHGLKYSLFYGRSGVREVGYDNERGKGDHRHFLDVETAYAFSTVEQLVADFWSDVHGLRGQK